MTRKILRAEYFMCLFALIELASFYLLFNPERITELQFAIDDLLGYGSFIATAYNTEIDDTSGFLWFSVFVAGLLLMQAALYGVARKSGLRLNPALTWTHVAVSSLPALVWLIWILPLIFPQLLWLWDLPLETGSAYYWVHLILLVNLIMAFRNRKAAQVPHSIVNS